LADIDGDGFLDIVTFEPKLPPGSVKNTLSRALKSGVDVEIRAYPFDGKHRAFRSKASFSAHASALEGNLVGGLYGDADGDGVKDLWLLGEKNVAVYLMKQSPYGSPYFSWSSPYTIWYSAVDDFNGDGLADFVIGHSGGIECFVSRGDGSSVQ
jgi:hypothetical protein